MRRYRVVITGNANVKATVEVSATSEDEAVDLAYEAQDIDWTIGDIAPEDVEEVEDITGDNEDKADNDET